MTSMTEPTITHPAWCSPRGCTYDPTDGGCHWGTTRRLSLHGTDGMPALCEVSLSQSDDDPTPIVWLEVSTCETFTIDELNQFATWLTAVAAECSAVSA